MKNIYLLVLGMLLAVAPCGLQAEDGAAAMQRIGGEVAALHLGLGDYFVGQILGAEQKTRAEKNSIAKTINGSYKFQDGEIYVVADKATDMVIGIYKEQAEASREDMQKMVGELMMQFEEPTTMAHDKLIYWAFGKEGRISEEHFEQARATGGEAVLATVKFSSSVAIAPSPAPETKEQEETVSQEDPASIYAMVSSDPLSKIFLSLHK
jgi:hypothetical protein